MVKAVALEATVTNAREVRSGAACRASGRLGPNHVAVPTGLGEVRERTPVRLVTSSVEPEEASHGIVTPRQRAASSSSVRSASTENASERNHENKSFPTARLHTATQSSIE